MTYARLVAAAALIAASTTQQAVADSTAAAGGVSYISGGAGNAETEALKHEARGYPLNLVFTAGRQSAYLHDVQVTIRDSAGRVLAHATSGPIMMVRLPSGIYRISAASRAGTIDRTVHIDAKGFRRVDFHWRNA
jgi:hypothetical protein